MGELMIDRAAAEAYRCWIPRGEPFHTLPQVLQADWRRLVKAVAKTLDVELDALYQEVGE